MPNFNGFSVNFDRSRQRKLKQKGKFQVWEIIFELFSLKIHLLEGSSIFVRVADARRDDELLSDIAHNKLVGGVFLGCHSLSILFAKSIKKEFDNFLVFCFSFKFVASFYLLYDWNNLCFSYSAKQFIDFMNIR